VGAVARSDPAPHDSAPKDCCTFVVPAPVDYSLLIFFLFGSLFPCRSGLLPAQQLKLSSFSCSVLSSQRSGQLLQPDFVFC
jgi:hypothetical protein